MRLVNFSIYKNYLLKIEQIEIDMHNDFDFKGHQFHEQKKVLKLKFSKSTGKWVHKIEVNNFALLFEGVDFWKEKAGKKDSSRQDQETVEFIGYLHPDEIDVMDGFLDSYVKNYHMIIGFSNNGAIKVSAKSVRFVRCKGTLSGRQK